MTATPHQLNRLWYHLNEIEKIKREIEPSGQIVQAHAFKMYGRGRVERWCRQGHINPVKQGRQIYYPTDKLIELASKYEYDYDQKN